MIGRVVIAVPGLSQHDAVSNDVRAQKQVLTTAGIETLIFAESPDPHAPNESISRSEFRRLSAQVDTLLIYHFCVYWPPLEEMLLGSRCRVVLRYHNITPPEWFDPYDREGAFATREGLRQMAEIAKHPRISVAMATSDFTLSDMEKSWGPLNATTMVVPPFLPSTLMGADTDERTKYLLEDGRTHLFFVGRWAPHKNHKHLLGVVSAYRELYGRDVCLTLAGGVSRNFSGYHAEIQALAEELGVHDLVRFSGSLSEAELATHYRHATAFLLMSDHEGFCVPIVEAQRFGLPVLAFERTAVTETIGRGQLTYASPDYDWFAAAAHKLKSDGALRKTLVSRGRSNVERYSDAAVGARLLSAMRSLA